MCLLGCLYRLFYKFLDPLNSQDLGFKFLYILVLWDMVSGFQTDIPSTYANLLKSLVVWIAIKVWLNEPLPQEAVRGDPTDRLHQWPSTSARPRLAR